MATLFSKIIAGEIPSFKIAENESCFAFLDINPLVEGHILVIPKVETDYIFDLDEKQLSALILFAKIIAVALKKAVPCKKVGISVIGLEVPHAHIHLIPMNHVGDMNFAKPKLNPPSNELSKMAERIKVYL
jgi:histidine triad (HIT) family protein